jgi:hypothetical protein
MISKASFSVASSMVNGGLHMKLSQRKIVNSPLSRKNFAIAPIAGCDPLYGAMRSPLAFLTTSTMPKSPMLRTAPTERCFAFSASMWPRITSPMRALFSTSFSSSSTSMTASAVARPTGCALYVSPPQNTLSLKCAATLSRIAITPSGK